MGPPASIFWKKLPKAYAGPVFARFVGRGVNRDIHGERDYVAIALQCAREVAAGKIIACKWVRLACERPLEHPGHGVSVQRLLA
jgi:hypothetical protein